MAQLLTSEHFQLQKPVLYPSEASTINQLDKESETQKGVSTADTGIGSVGFRFERFEVDGGITQSEHVE